MDMHVFQVESNKVLPQQGSILISSPFMNDYHFTRAVVLLIEHNDEGSMGIIMNKDFRYHILLNDLIPELEFAQRVPVYKGGPVSRETIFFLHTLKDLEGALPLGNGLYLNGDFNAVQQYILDGKPIEGVIRFFAGYAGWDHGQLAKEIKENSWLIGKAGKETLLNQHFRDLWHTQFERNGREIRHLGPLSPIPLPQLRFSFWTTSTSVYPPPNVCAHSFNTALSLYPHAAKSLREGRFSTAI